MCVYVYCSVNLYVCQDIHTHYITYFYCFFLSFFRYFIQHAQFKKTNKQKNYLIKKINNQFLFNRKFPFPNFISTDYIYI